MAKTTEYWREIEDHAAFARASVTVIMHPKKVGHARVLTAFPKDGAGRLTVYVVDGFGPDGYTTQKSTAGGYGYDKKTAALSGLTIDGHEITNHCAQDATSARLLKAYGKAQLTGDTVKADQVYKRAGKMGYSFTNYTSVGGYQPNAWTGYQSCYKLPGLDYLRALGYNVLEVL